MVVNYKSRTKTNQLFLIIEKKEKLKKKSSRLKPVNLSCYHTQHVGVYKTFINYCQQQITSRLI